MTKRRTKEELIAAGTEVRRQVETLYDSDTFNRCVREEMKRMEAERGTGVDKSHVSLWLEAAERHIYPCKCGGKGYYGKRLKRDKSNICFACQGKGRMNPAQCERQAKYEASRKAS